MIEIQAFPLVSIHWQDKQEDMTPQEAKEQLVELIETLWSQSRNDAEPIVEQLQYSEGDVVLAKNQQDDDLYYIQQGEVRIAKARQGSSEMSITLSTGDLIGEFLHCVSWIGTSYMQPPFIRYSLCSYAK